MLCISSSTKDLAPVRACHLRRRSFQWISSVSGRAVRHDVDHGGKQKASAKRKEIGSTFEKYSGKKTPAECSTEDFAVVQMRLLKAAREMLMTL